MEGGTAMTSEEYLKGARDEHTMSTEAAEWNAYRLSEEGFDELMALVEMECYDGPTGDA
jgi:hypothetical protein